MATVINALLRICAFFDWIIYELVTYTYVLFAAMCRLDPTNLGDTFTALTSRIKVFFGIVMLFVIAFNLLQYLADPSKAESGTSKLVQKIAISIVLLVSSTFIFQILGELQQKLIEQKIVEQLIMGEAAGEAESLKDGISYSDYISTGRWFSYNMLFSFLKIDSNAEKLIMDGTQSLDYMLDYVKGSKYEFPIVSGICGIFVAVMFVTFAIDIGLRAFNLMILQVISPIPLMAYIAPKGDGILDKYVKAYISTYVQLFIKLFTVYLTLYLMVYCMTAILDTASIGIVGGLTGEFQNNNMFGSVIPEGTPDFLRIIMVAVIFVALFKFAQALPKMIGEIFGIKLDDMGGMFKTTGAIVAGGFGLGLGTVGGFAAGIRGKAGVLGTLGAMGKGALGGANSGARAKDIKSFFDGQKTNKEGLNKFASGIGAQGGVGRSLLNKGAAALDSTAGFFRGDQRQLAENTIAKNANQKALEKNSERIATHQKLNEYENKVRSSGLAGALRERGFDNKEDAIKNMTAASEARLEAAKAGRNATLIEREYLAHQADIAAANNTLKSEADTYISDPAKVAADRELAESLADLNSHLSTNSSEFGGRTVTDATTLDAALNASRSTLTTIDAERRTLGSQKSALDAREKSIKNSKTSQWAKTAKTNSENEGLRRGYDKDSK